MSSPWWYIDNICRKSKYPKLPLIVVQSIAAPVELHSEEHLQRLTKHKWMAWRVTWDLDNANSPYEHAHMHIAWFTSSHASSSSNKNGPELTRFSSGNIGGMLPHTLIPDDAAQLALSLK